jgi:F-type H+-transporting ATPase subunit b
MRVFPGTIHTGLAGKPQPKRRQISDENRIVLFITLLMACTFRLTVAYASGGGTADADAGLNWPNFLWRTVNFFVLAGILYWFLAKKTKAFFSQRREGIRTSLAEAVIAREAAEKKFQEYSTKLDKATGEIEQISEMIRAQGLSEKTRIIEDARKTAEKMREDTRLRMEQEFNKAVCQLRIEAIRLSARMAEEILRKHVRAADHEAMVNDSIEKVVSKH